MSAASSRRAPVLDDRVVAAAAEVITQHGFADFTLERVAEAAGLSRVTLYRRGVTRENLLDALTIGVAQAYQAALWPALTGTGTGRERLLAALDALIDLLEAHRDLLAGLDSAPDPVFHLDGPDAGGDRSTRDVYLAPLARLLHDGARDGSLTGEGDPDELATLLFNVVPRVYVHLRVGHAWAEERARRSLVDLLFRGLDPR